MANGAAGVQNSSSEAVRLVGRAASRADGGAGTSISPRPRLRSWVRQAEIVPAVGTPGGSRPRSERNSGGLRRENRTLRMSVTS